MNKPGHLAIFFLLCSLAVAPSAVLAEPDVYGAKSPPNSPASLEEKVSTQLARAVEITEASRKANRGQHTFEDESADIINSIVAMGPAVIQPVLKILESKPQPDAVASLPVGRIINPQNRIEKLFCTMILGKLGEASANSLVETWKQKLTRQRQFELNQDYVTALSMIGESSIKPIVSMIQNGNPETSAAGLKILLAVLSASDQDHAGTRPSPSSFMGFAGNWIERYNSGTTLSATLPESLIPKLLDKSSKPIESTYQQSTANATQATLPVFTALGMLDHPSRQVVDVLKEALKQRPRKKAYDVGYAVWRRAAMSAGRLSLRDSKAFTDADVDEIEHAFVQAIEDSGDYGTAAAAADALSMLAIHHHRCGQEITRCIRGGIISSMSLQTVAGATRLMDTDTAAPIVEALLVSAKRFNSNDIDRQPGELVLALASLDSRFITMTVPILMNGWHFINNESGITPFAIMKTGIAGKAVAPKLIELAAKGDQFERYYNSNACVGCPASAVLYRQTFADCADSIKTHPHYCHMLADPENPMYYTDNSASFGYSTHPGELLVSFINPDELQFQALLEATPFVKEFQQFRPADNITFSTAKKTEEYKRTAALSYASKLYRKVLQLYAGSTGDQRALMGDAVRDYALVLEVRGNHAEAISMQDEFKKTGTLKNFPR